MKGCDCEGAACEDPGLGPDEFCRRDAALKEQGRMKTYKGTPELNDTDIAGDVTVHDPEENQGRGAQYPLAPRLDLRNHSPTGFAWNYHGSGPAQLALALLADVTGDDDFAQKHYQDFKRDHIGKLGEGAWEMTQCEISQWVNAKKAGR